MIELDNPKWSELQDAYGSAKDIPNLLKELQADSSQKTGAEAEPWFSLWSALCHQGDIYDASYAAVPHIVRILSEAAGSVDFNFFFLPVSIEDARLKGRGPKIPEEVEDEYLEAIRQLGNCISKFIDKKWNLDFTLSIFFTLAVLKGHLDLADKIDQLSD